MRRFEILKLMWKDIDFGKRLIKVWGKGRKFRTIPMNDLVFPFHTVQQLLGHHSVTVTQRYTHSSLESKRNAVDSLARIWHAKDPIFVESTVKSIS